MRKGKPFGQADGGKRGGGVEQMMEAGAYSPPNVGEGGSVRRNKQTTTYIKLKGETPDDCPGHKAKSMTLSAIDNSLISPFSLDQSVATPQRRDHASMQFLNTLSSLADSTRMRVHSHASSKRTSSVSLDTEVERLKLESTYKSREISELRKRIDAVETPKHNSDEKHFQKLVEIRNREIELLKEELRMGRKKAGMVLEQELKRLTDLYKTSESLLKETRLKLEETTKRLREIEEKQNAGGTLYQIIDCFQRENKTLKEELRRIQGLLISQESYYTLERQLREVEEMQNHLIAENRSLKSTLSDKDDLSNLRSKRLIEIINSLADRRKDLSQLSEIIRIISHGEGISAALIMGMPSDYEGEEGRGMEKDPVDRLVEELAEMKLEVGGLRQLLADLYAEQSGHLCVQQ